jgi:signal transduction histidine kinase
VRSLSIKLTLAFLLVSLTGIALVAVFVWTITAFEFNRFLIDRGLRDYSRAALVYYQQHRSWEGVDQAMRRQGLAAALPNSPGSRRQAAAPFALVDEAGQVWISSGRPPAGEWVDLADFPNKMEIEYQNRVVGFVLVTGGAALPDPFEQRYLARANQALFLAALVAAASAVLLGLFLARTITRPVRDLTAAAGALAQGKRHQPLPVRSEDELGELTRTFNTMSSDLAQANHLRRQMTADVAHDLRTPLTVLTGYLEGMKDGVLKPTPQRFQAMHDEALFLQRLVEDLRTLSLADSGELTINLQAAQPGEILRRVAAMYDHLAKQNGLRLLVRLESNLPGVRIDVERMIQALSNLVHNAIRYTPPGGEITLAATRGPSGGIRLEIVDTGAGIAPEVLPHVFERFYRADAARHEDGSGLGLAIARSIISLLGGTITAHSAGINAGSRFTIDLPAD